jgi:hypothetical protein
MELVVVFEFEGRWKAVEKIHDPDLALELCEGRNGTCAVLVLFWATPQWSW